MEKTLILIKPDAVKDNNIGNILSIYEKNYLKIIALRMMTMDDRVAAKHYAEHIGRPYYDKLVEFMTSGPLVAAVLQGENAINRVRILHGKTNPAEAAEGTIRSLYATDTRHNAVHASDSEENAKKEIHIFFSETEIFDI